jgi:hypothetical protein
MAAMAAALCAALPAFAGEPEAAGQYRLAEGPDAAGMLVLLPDGRFQYALAYGALDEHAEGHWQKSGSGITLTTQPKPVPAVFSALPRGPDGPETPTLLVTWPDGRGIAGIDFRIGFDSGDVFTGYTQEYGWSMSTEDSRNPVWIELSEPFHGTKSTRFAIDPAAKGTLHYVLTPNDMEVVDFVATPADITPDGLILHRREGDMRFIRQRD